MPCSQCGCGEQSLTVVVRAERDKNAVLPVKHFGLVVDWMTHAWPVPASVSETAETQSIDLGIGLIEEIKVCMETSADLSGV